MKSLNEHIQELKEEQMNESASGAMLIALALTAPLIYVKLFGGDFDFFHKNNTGGQAIKSLKAQFKKMVGTDKKAKAILQELTADKEAMEDIKNAKNGKFRATIQKHLSPADFEYIKDATRKNLDTKELSDGQLIRRDTKGNIKKK